MCEARESKRTSREDRERSVSFIRRCLNWCGRQLFARLISAVGVYILKLIALATRADADVTNLRARSIVQCTSRTCGSIALGVPNRLDFAGGDISQVAQAFPFHCQFAISAQICFRRRTKWKSNMQIYAATIDLHKFCALTCSLLTPCNVLRTRKFYILRRARELLIIYGMNDCGQRVEWSASQCALEVVRYVWTCAMRRN